MQISLEDAASVAKDYDRIVWVHTQYTPKEEGIEMIAKSLGVDKSKIAASIGCDHMILRGDDFVGMVVVDEVFVGELVVSKAAVGLLVGAAVVGSEVVGDSV